MSICPLSPWLAMQQKSYFIQICKWFPLAGATKEPLYSNFSGFKVADATKELLYSNFSGFTVADATKEPLN